MTGLIPDGVFLNLDHQVYIDDPAAGGGSIKDWLEDIEDWHARKRNPVWMQMLAPKGENAAKESADTLFGTAAHCAVLEPWAFDERYMVEPTIPDWPDTKGQIADAIKHAGGTPPKDSALRIQFVAMARMMNIKTSDDWEDELAQMSAGRIRISAKWKFELLTLQRVIERHSAAQQFLTGGRSEVSVFYTDERGHRYKCRFDYLRVKFAADVKTYMKKKGKGPVDSFLAAVSDFCYDLAAVHYMDIRKNHLPRLVQEGRVYDGLDMVKDADGVWSLPEASVDDVAFMNKVAAFENPSWWWIACCKWGVPRIDCIEFPTDILAYASSETQLENAKERYRQMREAFGDDDSELWVEDRGLIRLTDANFSMRQTNRSAILYDTIRDN